MQKTDVKYYPGKDYRELFDILVDSNVGEVISIGITNDGSIIYIDDKLMNNSSAYWTQTDIFSIDRDEFRKYLDIARSRGHLAKALKKGLTTEEELERLSK